MKNLCYKTINSCQIVAFWLVFLLVGCQSLPSTPHLDKSLALGARLSQLPPSPVLAYPPPNAHQSGYHLISTGANAFASRSILSTLATRNIDVQYYIWHDDEAGLLMLQYLWQAAERGVIVRLLLDDVNSSSALDKWLLAFASHPNIAVRVVNPFVYRRFKSLNYLTEPLRLNRRMHNKSMTFDNQVSIIGGRNIGNEYLNKNTNNSFADLDVLLVGAVVQDISQSFEQYWQSGMAYDIETLVKPKTPQNSAMFSEDIDLTLLDSKNQHALQAYQNAINNATIDASKPHPALHWADMVFVADDAKKLQQNAPRQDYLISQLQQMLGRPSQRLSMISSYFVPTKEGVKVLTSLAKSGIKISILTNSFDATDVGMVHLGYGQWRKDLLKAGIRLYELKSTAQSTHENENKLWRTKQITSTSLHAKAFAVDDKHVFIGSYNIDPRSANINTELGVVIQDSDLARRLHQLLGNDHPSMIDEQDILQRAYEVSLDKNGHLQWRTLENGKEIVYNREPKMSTPEKVGVWLLGILPLDWLL